MFMVILVIDEMKLVAENSLNVFEYLFFNSVKEINGLRK